MRSNRLGWILLAPTLIFKALFGIIPFLYVVWVSFQQWNPFGANPNTIYDGADNFRRLVFDGEFFFSVWITLQFVAFVVISGLILGYFLAQLLQRDFPGKGAFRTIHTLPLIVAPIVVGSVWRLMTTPSIGVIPHLLDGWFGYDMDIGRDATRAFWSPSSWTSGTGRRW